VAWLHAVIMEYVETNRFVGIGGLVVDRNHRRGGIGAMLMKRAEEWAREQGLSILRLSSSTARTESHRFYEQLGYTNIKTQCSFIKSLDTGRESLSEFVPRVDNKA
jgi:GNAT superfamily N-acetyltransferase